MKKNYNLLNNNGYSLSVLSDKKYTIDSKCEPVCRPEVIRYLSTMFPQEIAVPEQAKLFQSNVATYGR
jgi:hypothetical protein